MEPSTNNMERANAYDAQLLSSMGVTTIGCSAAWQGSSSNDLELVSLTREWQHCSGHCGMWRIGRDWEAEGGKCWNSLRDIFFDARIPLFAKWTINWTQRIFHWISEDIIWWNFARPSINCIAFESTLRQRHTASTSHCVNVTLRQRRNASVSDRLSRDTAYVTCYFTWTKYVPRSIVCRKIKQFYFLNHLLG